MRWAGVLSRLARALLLLGLVMLGTVVLVRLAPGYFASADELNSAHAATARARLAAEQAAAGTVGQEAWSAARALLHGDLGESRQYGLPVGTLLRPRVRSTALLLVRSLGLGWLLAVAGACWSTAARRRAVLPGALFTLLLAAPTAALATVCLLNDSGGPVLVLGLVLAARDFPFLDRLLREVWASSALLQARAGGLGWWRMLRAHVFPAAAPQMRALVTLSVVTALSALVPVEVLFDLPGVAQLAWSAAGNRDLPVLLAVTLLLATFVAAAGLLSEPPRVPELA